MYVWFYSDESNGSEDDCTKIPHWAQRDALESALSKQFGPHAIDPTPSIFPDFVDSGDLEGMMMMI